MAHEMASRYLMLAVVWYFLAVQSEISPKNSHMEPLKPQVSQVVDNQQGDLEVHEKTPLNKPSRS